VARQIAGSWPPVDAQDQKGGGGRPTQQEGCRGAGAAYSPVAGITAGPALHHSILIFL
jgi:hypothetical protein